MLDEIPKHRKSRKKIPKPYSIEYRCTPNEDGTRLFGNSWRVAKRYTTEARREEAFRALMANNHYFEYRRGGK